MRKCSWHEEDSRIELRDKISEYLAFGVEYFWVIDPFTRQGMVFPGGRDHR